MNQQSILDIFKSYSKEKWMDWIDDLLHFQTAYPVLNIPSDRDQLTDVPGFLEKNGISTKFYGKALIDTFYNFITVYPDSPYLERLLDAVIFVRPNNTTDVLKDLFLDRQIDKVLLPDGDPVKGLLLLGLIKSNLEEQHLQEILGYCNTIGMPLIKENAHFMGHYFRFVARKRGVKKYFSELTFLFQNLPAQDGRLQVKEEYLSTLKETVEEVWFYQTGVFYPEFYAWVVGDFDALQVLPAFNWLINSLAQDIRYLFDIMSSDPRKQYNREYIVALRSFVVLWNDECLKEEINAGLIHLVTSFFVKRGGEEIVKRILNKNKQFICGRVWIYDREITDCFNGYEEVSDDEIYELLKSLFRGFFETRPEVDYESARQNPDLMRQVRQRARAHNESNLRLLNHFYP